MGGLREEPGGGLVGSRGVGKGFAWRECVTNVEGWEEVGEKGNRGKEMEMAVERGRRGSVEEEGRWHSFPAAAAATAA